MKMTSYLSILSLLVGLFLGITNDLLAQTNIKIAEEDKELNIRGFWNQNENDLDGYVQMTLRGNSLGELRILTFDLINNEDPNYKINRGSIRIAPVTLVPNEPTNVKILIDAIPAAGKYVGKVKFYIAGTQNYAEVPVEVVATLQDPNRAQILDSVVHAKLVGSTWLNFLLPTDLRSKEFAVTVQNRGEADLVINDYSFFARKGNNRVLDKTRFAYDGELPFTIAGGTRKTLHFTLKKSKNLIGWSRYLKLTPGSYEGDLQLDFHEDSKAAPVKVNLKIDSRAGVGWVLFVLFIGIIVGKIIKDLATPKAEMQVALMGEVQELKERISKLERANSGSDFALGLEYKKLIEKINKATLDDEEMLRKEITAFDARLDVFFKLTDTISKIKANTTYSKTEKQAHSQAVRAVGNALSMGTLAANDVPNRIKLLQETWKMNTSIESVKQNNADDHDIIADTKHYDQQVNAVKMSIIAGKSKTEIESRLEELDAEIREQLLNETPSLTPKGVTPRDANDKPNTDATTKPTTNQNENSNSLINKIARAFGQPLKYLLFILMDYKEPNASIRYWFFKPLLTIIILVAAILAGLQDAYIENGITFGTGGFVDYFDLIIYGASSKIAASTIGDLGERGAQSLNTRPRKTPSNTDDIPSDIPTDIPEDFDPEPDPTDV